MSTAGDQRKLQEAFSLHQSGKLAEAAKLYRQLIRNDPDNLYALHFLGVIESVSGNREQAKILMARSLASGAPNIAFVENYATILAQTEDYKTALQVSRQGLQQQQSIPLLYVSAIALFKLNQLPESLQQFDRLLAVAPNHVAALNEKGTVLAELKQYNAALGCFEKSLALDPRHAETFLNRGNLYSELERYDEAAGEYDKALALKPNLADAWLGRGNVLRILNRFDEALAAYDKSLALMPGLAQAWAGRGNILFESNSYDEALACYEKSIALKGDLAAAFLGRGNVLTEFKRYDEALSAYAKALELKGDMAEAWLGRGNASFKLKQFDEALAAYEKTLAVKPQFANAEAPRLYAKMQLCDWRNFGPACETVVSSVRAGNIHTSPFEFLAVPSSPGDQLKCAKLWVAKKFPPSANPLWQQEKYDHDRIRLAYLSADFREHPVGLLIPGMFECHDKSRFEVTALSCGPDDGSELRRRTEASVERFIDVNAYSDSQLAELIEEAEVDILVDLMGFTGSRMNVVARRPAPVQVSHLGYLGTMGADYIDYIIADRIVIPEAQRDDYTEKVVYLPNSFQPTDRERRISEQIFTREEAGLPRDGFVFCCFNTNYKITPDIFDVWMRILKKVEGSVLWLVDAGATVKSHLKSEAAKRGVDAERLIFAPRMPLSEHQARLRLADLFLDTPTYNAGATASDTLWSGVPILTLMGNTFVGRMAASVLNAVGLPELIATTSESYERIAVELATQPEKMAAIKAKLANNRLAAPLFDTKLFTKHMEVAYNLMFERQQAGLTPEHIVVPG